MREIKQEIARGYGEYLQAFAFLSACDAEVAPAFNAALQAEYAKLAPIDNLSTSFSVGVDRIVKTNATLRGRCLHGLTPNA